MSAGDALDQLNTERDLLPARCPRWCIGGHAQSLEEGNDLESSCMHVAGDVGLPLHVIRAGDGTEIRPHVGFIDLGLNAEQPTGAWDWRQPLLVLDLYQSAGGRSTAIKLTSGEARVLARQLTHYADLADLP